MVNPTLESERGGFGSGNPQISGSSYIGQGGVDFGYVGWPALDVAGTKKA